MQCGGRSSPWTGGVRGTPLPGTRLSLLEWLGQLKGDSGWGKGKGSRTRGRANGVLEERALWGAGGGLEASLEHTSLAQKGEVDGFLQQMVLVNECRIVTRIGPWGLTLVTSLTGRSFV